MKNKIIENLRKIGNLLGWDSKYFYFREDLYTIENLLNSCYGKKTKKARHFIDLLKKGHQFYFKPIKFLSKQIKKEGLEIRYLLKETSKMILEIEN